MSIVYRTYRSVTHWICGQNRGMVHCEVALLWFCSLLPQDTLLDRSQTWNTQHILICCVCLGDNSEDADEIIQCDNCGVTVHEGKLQSWFSKALY